MIPDRYGADAIDHVDGKPCLASRLNFLRACPATESDSFARTFHAPVGVAGVAVQRPVSEHVPA